MEHFDIVLFKHIWDGLPDIFAKFGWIGVVTTLIVCGVISFIFDLFREGLLPFVTTADTNSDETKTTPEELEHMQADNSDSSATADGWYYEEGNRTVGPITDETIAEMLKNGTLQNWTMVRRGTGPRVAASMAIQFYQDIAESQGSRQSSTASSDSESRRGSTSSQQTRSPADAGSIRSMEDTSNGLGVAAPRYTEREIHRIGRWHRLGSFLVPLFVVVLLIDVAELACDIKRAEGWQLGPLAIAVLEVLHKSFALAYVVAACAFMVGAACARKVGRAATIGWMTIALTPLICFVSLVVLGKWTAGMQESVLMVVVGITAIIAWLVFPLIALRRTQRALRDYDAYVKMFGAVPQ